MKILEKLKNTSSSNEKLEILESGLNILNELLIRKSLNDEVFGINNKTLMKVFNIESLKGYEDIGEAIEDKLDVNNSYKLDIDKIESWFINVKQRSGKNLIQYLKSILIDSRLDITYVKWLVRALNKDLKIKMGISQVNKVFKKLNKPLIERFIVQLCKIATVGELDYSKDLTIQPKLDGMRAIAYIDKMNIMSDYEIKIVSRANKDITKQFPEIIRSLENFAEENIYALPLVIDGEILETSFNKLQRRITTKQVEESSTIKYILYDLLSHNNMSIKKDKYNSRFQILNMLKYNDKIKLIKSYKIYAKEDAKEHYDLFLEQGYEGAVVKDMNGTYAEENKETRKNAWKLKPTDTLDLEITGIELGSGRFNGTVGALIVENKDKTIKAKVGTGMSDEMRDYLMNLVLKKELFGKIVEIKYGEMTPENNGVKSLRWPVFIGIREDKLESD